MSLEFRTLQPEEFYRQHVEAGVRPDGRHLAERRAMAVSAGNISVVRIFKCFFYFYECSFNSGRWVSNSSTRCNHCCLWSSSRAGSTSS